MSNSTTLRDKKVETIRYLTKNRLSPITLNPSTVGIKEPLSSHNLYMSPTPYFFVIGTNTALNMKNE